MRYEYTPFWECSMATKIDNAKCLWKYRATGILNPWYWEYEMVQTSWKTLAVSYKVKHTLNTNISHKEIKNYAYRKICTQMFIAIPFIITKNWETSKCPSVGEWIKKLLHAYNGILPSPAKEQATDTCNNISKT